MFLSANDIQLGRGEPIKDTARVHGPHDPRRGHPHVRPERRRGICAAIPASRPSTRSRTTSIPARFSRTFSPSRKSAAPSRARSSRSSATARATWRTRGFSPRRNLDLNCASPRRRNFSRQHEILKRAGGKYRRLLTDIKAAAKGADLLYTDVWISMGKEAEAAERIENLNGYQINAPW